MKRSIVKQLVGAMLLSTGLILPSGILGAAETEARTTIPATVPGIWQAIDGHIQKLNSAISENSLANVHVYAYAVRDLVRALPARPQDLSAPALAKIKVQSKFVDTLAERLDQTGDANDKPGTESNLHKLEGVLKLIRAQYPVAIRE